MRKYLIKFTVKIMGYATWRSWVATQLDTISGLNVYAYPTDKISYPAAKVRIGESEADEEQETNQSIFRTYEIIIELVVGANTELQDPDDVERIFAEKLDAIVELFDAVGNRHPNDDNASRQRVTRVVPRDAITPEAKRIAEITLEFYKRNR